ncbi:hypothetical protein DNTS_016240 [Danionella cerebrum]|uniref:C2H2-type domain-containing protein n=1 Tax=Danionella cerebrum TaxID=2873325 RepID=A0A553Q0Q2_9TELE|nr:hypothetical protein DNTS_016240 [Danionella translucida]
MAENLYETNSQTNQINRSYVFHQNPDSLHTNNFGFQNMSSIQSSSLSPRHTNEHLRSPGTPGHDLSPKIDMPTSRGGWDYNQFGRTPSWGSSSHEEIPERSQSFLFNTTAQNSPLNPGDSPQSLDSFSKAFPMKNIQMFFGDRDISRDSNMSQGLQEGRNRAFLEESPIFFPIGQSQTICDQFSFNTTESQHTVHNLYQNQYQFRYESQQHKQKVNSMEELNKISWHFNQNHPMAYQMGLPGMTAHALESNEYLQTMSFNHHQDFQISEHLISHINQDHRSTSEHNSSYTATHSEDQSVPARHDTLFGDHHSSPNTQLFSSPKEDQCEFNFMHTRGDLSSTMNQGKRSAICKTLPQSNTRPDPFDHIPPCIPQWSQKSLPELENEDHSPHSRFEQNPGTACVVYRAQPVLSRNAGSAKLRCDVCQKEFKSLPALNGHKRSHGALRTLPATLKMREEQIYMSTEAAQTDPIILPVSIKRCTSNGASPLQQRKKRHRRCLVPLLIPPAESKGTVLFNSRLRNGVIRVGESQCIPYTPPPMLNPRRHGSGLFNSISGLAGFGDTEDCAEESSERVIKTTPQINVGEDFQAKIPDINNKSLTEKDPHDASLLWSPTRWVDGPDNQEKVDNLLKMASSSVLPGGGMNTEYVLHCLFECRGNILVKTKSVGQCVEYYYSWKKHLHLGTSVSVPPNTPVQEEQPTNVETCSQTNPHRPCSSPMDHSSSTLTELMVSGMGSIRSSPSNSTTSGDTDSVVVFPCSECGKVFLKVKSRNAHMKTHRHQEDTPLWQLPRVPEQDSMILMHVFPITPQKEPIRFHSTP